MARTRKTPQQMDFRTDTGRIFRFRLEGGAFVCDEDFPTELDGFEAVCDPPVGIFNRDNQHGNPFLQVRFHDGTHNLVSFIRRINPVQVTASFVDVDRLYRLCGLSF